jgi:hypothetical protein
VGSSILKLIGDCTGSQCRLSRLRRIGVMCSVDLVQGRILAARFWTSWNLLMSCGDLMSLTLVKSGSDEGMDQGFGAGV